MGVSALPPLGAHDFFACGGYFLLLVLHIFFSFSVLMRVTIAFKVGLPICLRRSSSFTLDWLSI